MTTPLPHNYGSFSYKVTDKKIQDILYNRSKVSNVVQVGMPFVKVTSTVEIPELLGSNNVGFTLGIHGLLDAGYESIYQERSTAPLVGYTYTPNGNNQKVWANTSVTNDAIANFFTKNIQLQDLPVSSSFNRVPPPGITSVKIGTNRSGLSQTAEIQLSVPSLQQLEYLNRVFLIPGCGMVVEWGQQFASDNVNDYGEAGLLRDIQQKMFPWYNRTKLKTLLERLGKRQVGLEEILNQYVYETQGQYMWMFGRVANIATQGNADGSFDITVTLKGPAEDQWAYSVRQTAFSSAGTSGQVCSGADNSIESYLTNDTVNGFNLKTLLDDVLKQPGLSSLPISPGWYGHVVKVTEGNRQDGESESSANVDQSSFADSKDAYFMTWRFFVNVVLNNPQYGIKAIFTKANLPEEAIEKLGLIRPYGTTSTNLYVGGDENLNDPYENYVGANQWLRSYDPGTLIIVNKYATKEASTFLQRMPGGNQLLSDPLKGSTTINAGLEAKGDFLTSAESVSVDQAQKGFLSTGVWVNHKAVISSLLSGNTLLQGISNLLGKMNNATKGYWKLTLDVSDPVTVNDKYDYTVVDENYRGSSETAIDVLLNGEPRIYTFNKFLRNFSSGVVGSELTEFNLNLDLPKLLFSQIATLGISEPDDIESATKTASILNPCSYPSISDANNNLRRLIGISTVSPGRGGKSIDLTNVSTPPVSGQCTDPTQGTLPGGVAGPRPAVVPPQEGDTDVVKKLKEQQKEAEEYLTDPDNNCNKCDKCYERITASGGQVSSGVPQANGSGVLVQPSFRTNGTNVPRIVTRVTFEETFQALKDLGCSDTLILSTMATMLVEQPWSENGKRLGYKASNYNFAGVDVTNANWTYNPAYHNGYIYLTEGGTGYIKAFASFVDLKASLYFKAQKLKQEARNINLNGKVIRFDQSERLTADEYAAVYYVKWNGLGFRTLNKQLYADSTAAQRREFPSTRFAADDAKGMANAKSAYNFILSQFASRLPGRTTTNLIQQPTTPPVPVTPAQPPQNPVPAPTPQCPNELRTSCAECIRQDNIVRQGAVQVNNAEVIQNAAAAVERQFPNLNQAIAHFERLPDRMMALIRCSADGNKSNAMGTAPGSLSIKAEMTLPGIAGIRVGELFWIDRVPVFYKIFGAFQIMSFEQVIGQEGWQTKISAQFNTLGNAWKNTMLDKLRKEGIPI